MRHASAVVALSLRQGYHYFNLLTAAPATSRGFVFWPLPLRRSCALAAPALLLLHPCRPRPAFIGRTKGWPLRLGFPWAPGVRLRWRSFANLTPTPLTAVTDPATGFMPEAPVAIVAGITAPPACGLRYRCARTNHHFRFWLPGFPTQTAIARITKRSGHNQKPNENKSFFAVPKAKALLPPANKPTNNKTPADNPPGQQRRGFTVKFLINKIVTGKNLEMTEQ